MSVKSLRVTVPPGMEAALEGLARAVLKEQPEDIYVFAADHFEQLVRKRDSIPAHNAGISPSSTQESNSKQPVSEDGTRPIQEERSITEEPESNDTSYGVEATAVRTLAATTGTVAILGTTAKTKGEDGEDRKSSNSAAVETIPEEQEEVAVDVAKAVVHEQEKRETPKEEETRVKHEEPSSIAGSRPNSRPNNVEEVSQSNLTNVEIEKDIPSSASNEVKDDTPENKSPVENKSPASDSNQSDTVSPNTKSPVIVKEELESKNAETLLEPAVGESVKDKEEDASKSISSERLKTNSISNTTLSSDSIVEFENNSVKQSPSTDKVIESFDSSSTVEFVDTAAKEVLKQEGNKTNPARSVSSDLSVKSNLPLDVEKSSDLVSPEEKENNITDEELPPPPPPLEEGEVTETPPSNKNDDSKENEQLDSNITSTESQNEPDASLKDDIHNDESSQNEQLDSNITSTESQNEPDASLKDDIHNDESSLNSEVSSNMTNSIQTVAINDVQEISSKSEVGNSNSIASEENDKAESRSPLSSGNNSLLNDNVETTLSPVTAVSCTPAPVSQESTEANSESRQSQHHTGVEKSDETKSNPEAGETKADREENVIQETVNPIDKVEDQNIKEDLNFTSQTENLVNSAVECDIKLTNGFSTRSETPNSTEAVKSPEETKIESSNVEAKNSIEKVVNGLPESKSEKNKLENASDLPDLSDEKVIAAATTIQASFRGFHTRQNLKSSGQCDVESSKLENTNDEKDLEKGNSIDETPKTTETALKTEDPESILENVDDKMVTAATKIQANVRGFLTRQTLKSNVDSGLAPSEERRTPSALTPELIESVKEEVDDICKEAEAIAAERSESVEGVLRGVQHVVVGAKEAALPSVSDSILAVRGSVTPPSVGEVVDADGVFGSLTDLDERTVDAATTIQTSFRGYQARKALQDNTEQPDSMPDYPPPEECLDDLPPPDFEALESSYSEDVPTEPLAPPPPPDCEIFNEEDEDELAALQRPGECAELPEHRLTDSEPSDSSLSSAATKIQAGVRGFLTRKQIQTAGGTGTTSTSTNRTAADSDGSWSVDGLRSAISTEEESEVTRHRASPDSEPAAVAAAAAEPRPSRSATKRMSLAEPPCRSHAPMRSRALSVQVAGAGPVVSDEEVWNTLRSEMADAATKIQSNFRGYRARKQLQREDAVQGTSSSSQATPTPTGGSVEAPAVVTTGGSVEAPGAPAATTGGSVEAPGAPAATTGGSVEAPGAPAATTGGSAEALAAASSGGSVEAPGAATTGGSVEAPGAATTGGCVEAPAEAASATARTSGEYHDIIALSPPSADNPPSGEEPAAAAAAGSGEEPVADQPADAMVKRRASEDEAGAATKIQATFRGHKARQEMKDVDRAAAKIQAGFRGYKVRKEMKRNGESGAGVRRAESADPQTEQAAVKIQAGVRGFLVRRRVQRGKSELATSPAQ